MQKTVLTVRASRECITLFTIYWMLQERRNYFVITVADRRPVLKKWKIRLFFFCIRRLTSFNVLWLLKGVQDHWLFLLCCWCNGGTVGRNSRKDGKRSGVSCSLLFLHCVTEVQYVLKSMDDQWTVSFLSFNSTHPNRAASFALSSAAFSRMAVTEAVSVNVRKLHLTLSSNTNPLLLSLLF